MTTLSTGYLPRDQQAWSRTAEGVLFHDRGTKKGGIIEARVYYDEASAKRRQHWHKQRADRRTARVFSRTVKAGGVELVLWVVIARAKPEAL